MNDREKKKLRKYLFRATIILILIPIGIDRFFAHEWYMIWCNWMREESPMKVSEWFGFLGSYLSVIGSIIIGIIAYWQTHIINKQNEDYSHLQQEIAKIRKDIDVFQTHPIISVSETKIDVVNNLKQRLETKRKIEDYYFTVFGKQSCDSGIRYIMITVQFEDRGIIPTVQCEILDLKWEIAGNEYDIKLDKDKRIMDTYDRIVILIDDNDSIIDKDAFFEDVNMHMYYFNNGKVGYGKSILKLKVCFSNQKEKEQTYDITYRVKSGDQKLDPGIPFLKSEKRCDNEKR